ncbi:M16 family metallopeptidase [Caloramator sp. mosi_1]|uniref:M16 family metallopeptidase n=1 Tax=Caloramator sp. mosi_1 TaxID=3023090 RepID=UPI003FCD35F4
MTKDKITNYMSKTYNYKNIVIAIAGNFDQNRILEKLESYFSKDNFDKNEGFSISAPQVNNSILVKQKDIEQVHIGLALNGIELGNEEIYTLSAINNYFGGGTSSRLFQRLREENGLVYTIYSFPSSYINCGSFNIYFALNEVHVERAISYIKEEIYNLCKLGIGSEQIKKAKEQLKGNYILGLESVANRMFSMGKSLLLQDKVYEPSEVLSKIDQITESEINSIIEKIFSKGIKSVAVVGKNVDEEKYKKLIWG